MGMQAQVSRYTAEQQQALIRYGVARVADAFWLTPESFAALRKAEDELDALGVTDWKDSEVYRWIGVGAASEQARIQDPFAA